MHVYNIYHGNWDTAGSFQLIHEQVFTDDELEEMFLQCLIPIVESDIREQEDRLDSIDRWDLNRDGEEKAIQRLVYRQKTGINSHLERSIHEICQSMCEKYGFQFLKFAGGLEINSGTNLFNPHDHHSQHVLAPIDQFTKDFAVKVRAAIPTRYPPHENPYADDDDNDSE